MKSHHFLLALVCTKHRQLEPQQASTEALRLEKERERWRRYLAQRGASDDRKAEVFPSRCFPVQARTFQTDSAVESSRQKTPDSLQHLLYSSQVSISLTLIPLRADRCRIMRNSGQGTRFMIAASTPDPHISSYQFLPDRERTMTTVCCGAFGFLLT